MTGVDPALEVSRPDIAPAVPSPPDETPAPLCFEVVDWEEYPGLGGDWQALEARAAPSFFLSWHWISTWIDVYDPQPRVLRARAGERVVGLALLVRSDLTRRFALVRSRSLLLNQTGDKSKDQVWIEYNGILVESAYRDTVYARVVEYLLRSDDEWEELIVGGIEVDGASALLEASREAVWHHREWQVPCYGVDLAALRGSGGDYLGTLSANARRQIKRCHNLYGETGEVRITSPSSPGEALASLNRIAELHLARWGAGLDRSGFANPEFVVFHRELILRLWAAGVVELVEVRVGDRLIAGFLNFVYRNQVYFYLSGIVEEQDNRLRPGLLGHALCIQRYLENGIDFYDFMGGNERYKARLATVHTELTKVVIQRKKFKFAVEHAGRLVKRAVRPGGRSADV